MPLHLLGKKSWNVYNPANIARVKADEAAAAAREAADEQRMQELDAERRAAILRGRTPPPLPEADTKKDGRVARDRDRDDRGHDRKRRRLAGEDDTDRDIRLANSAPGPKGSSEESARILKLRNSASDAPLTDHAGNINLFPVDLKEVGKREKNAEAEKEKKKKEQALEDQYTMRFSNAAGKGGLEKPWYAGERRNECLQADGSSDKRIDYPGFESKDVWGNEDPLRKEREQARIASNDPFAFMQKAQAQLKKSKEDKKRWTKERNRELNDLKATQERVDAGRRHEKRRRREDNMVSREEKHGSSKHKHRHRSRSLSRERRRSRDRRDDRDSSRRHERRHSRSRSRSRDRHRESSRRQDEKSSRRHERTNRSPNHRDSYDLRGDSRPRYEDHVEKIVSK